MSHCRTCPATGTSSLDRVHHRPWAPRAAHRHSSGRLPHGGPTDGGGHGPKMMSRLRGTFCTEASRIKGTRGQLSRKNAVTPRLPTTVEDALSTKSNPPPTARLTGRSCACSAPAMERAYRSAKVECTKRISVTPVGQLRKLVIDESGARQPLV